MNDCCSKRLKVNGYPQHDRTCTRGLAVGDLVTELDWPYGTGTIHAFGNDYETGCRQASILVGGKSLHTRSLDLLKKTATPPR